MCVCRGDRPDGSAAKVKRILVETLGGDDKVAALLSGGVGDDTLIADRDDSVVGGKGTDGGSLSLLRGAGTGTVSPSIDPEEEFGDNASGIESFALAMAFIHYVARPA